MDFRTFSVPRDPDCAVCGEDPTVLEPVDYEQFCSAGSESTAVEVPEIEPQELQKKLDSGEELLLLDVREPFEWDVVHIEGARLVPLGELPQRIGDLEPWRNRAIVVHCHHGGRSRSACHLLLSHGFDQVVNLRNGIDGWSLEVDPSVPRY
jgi:adenylyltransferase/sulfurtransferase